MTWGMVAVAGASLVGGAMQSKAASRAAKGQQDATNRATDLQLDMYQQTRDDTTPQRQVGYNALASLAGELGLPSFASQPAETYEDIRLRLTPQFRGNFGGNGINDVALDQAAAAEAQRQKEQGYGSMPAVTSPRAPADLTAEVMADPGYQFGQQQGQQALDRKIAAMGGRVSGNALKAATRFGTDYASTGYNAAYQRRQDRLNRLQELAGMGQVATGASAAAGGQAANAISGLISSQGDANAASRLAQGNIWGNAGNQLAALYGRQQQSSPWASPSANPFSNRGGSFGTSGMDDFYYGHGTGGD